MGRLILLLVPACFLSLAHGNANCLLARLFTAPSGAPLVKLNSSIIRLHSKEQPDSPEQPPTRKNNGFPFDRPAGRQRFLRGGQATPSGLSEEVRESYLCNCRSSLLRLLDQARARCVALGTREAEIVCQSALAWRAERHCSAGQPRPWSELLSHCRVGPAAFCCRDIERSVVAPGRIDDGHVGGFCLLFSSVVKAVLESATCPRV